MGKKSRKGRATAKPKHSAAGAGGSRRSTGSIASDMLSQSQATSMDGGRGGAKTPMTTKAPPLNVMVPSPMPVSNKTDPIAFVKHDETKAADTIIATPSSTAESTPETSPNKTVTAEEGSKDDKFAVNEEKKEDSNPEATTKAASTPSSATVSSIATVTPAALSVATEPSPRSTTSDAPAKASPTTQHPITPDEVMRSTVSLRDQFEMNEFNDDSNKAVLDISVDEMAWNVNETAKDETKADNKADAAGNLNLNSPSFQEATDDVPQGGDCCIIQ